MSSPANGGKSIAHLMVLKELHLHQVEVSLSLSLSLSGFFVFSRKRPLTFRLAAAQYNKW